MTVTLPTDAYRAAKADLWMGDIRSAIGDHWMGQVQQAAENYTPPDDTTTTPPPRAAAAPTPAVSSPDQPQSTPEQTYRSQVGDDWMRQVNAAATMAAGAQSDTPTTGVADSVGTTPNPPVASPPLSPTAPVTAPLVPPAPAPAAPVTAPLTSSNGPAARTSQFALGLTDAEAYAACGPAAAIAFVNSYGRNPTAQEALNLARQVGWTANQGMAGVQSEQALLGKLGVPTKLEQGVDWNHVAQDANAGNPVIIDTPGHYFYVTGARQGPNGLEFNFGTSATDLKAAHAQTWLTAAQVANLGMGAPRAALYADNPNSPTPSIAAQTPAPNTDDNGAQRPGAVAGPLAGPQASGATSGAPASPTASPSTPTANPLQGVGDVLGGAASTVQQKASDLGSFLRSLGREPTDQELSDYLSQQHEADNQANQQTSSAVGNAATSFAQQGPIGAFTSQARGLGQDIASSPPGQWWQNTPGVLDSLQTIDELNRKYTPPDKQNNALGQLYVRPETMTPEDRARYENANLAVAGVTGGEGTNGPPVTGAGILQSALDRLGQYPEDAVQGIKAAAFDAQAQGAPASTVGAQLQRWIEANPLEKFTAPPQLPNAVRARARAADMATTNPPAVVGPGSAVRDARLLANDAYGGAEPPVEAGQQFTRDPQGNIVPLNEQPATDTTSGLQNMLDARRGGRGGTGDYWNGGAAQSPLPPEPTARPTVAGGFAPEPTLPPNEYLPGGPQQGQLGMFGNDQLPYGGAAPTGTEALGPAGAQRGQLQMDSELPIGGPPPVGTEAQGPAGIQPGQTTPLPGFPTPTKSATPLDLLNQYHRNNVVSGVSTLAHVAANTVINPVWSATTHGAADMAMLRFDRLAGRSIGQYTALANIGGDFMSALSQHLTDPAAVMNRVDNPALKFGLQAQAMLGGGLHAAFQNVAQNATQRMEYGALAGEQAAREGLSGGEFATRVGDLISDPSQLGSGVAAVKDIAQRAALRAEGGNIQKALVAISKIPVIGNTLFPVVRISSQALAQGIEKSPLGFLGTGADVADAKLFNAGPYAKGFNVPGGAVTPLNERLLNNIGGTALSLFFVSKALDGTLTGNGPTDPAQRALLVSQGWQPNSLYVPGLGYRDTHSFGPLAQPLAQVAAIGDAALYAKADASMIDRAGIAAQSLAHYLEGTTGLQTIAELGQLMQGGTDTAKLAASFLGNVAGGYVPESGLVRSAALATDSGPAHKPELGPNTGEDWLSTLNRGVSQTIQQNIPGLRANVPTTQDVLGRNENNMSAGPGVLLPRGGGGTPSDVLAAFQRAGATIPPRATSVTIANTQIPLSIDEQRSFEQTRGALLQTVTSKIIADPRFAAAPPPQQRMVLEKAVAEVDTAARQQVLASMARGGQLTQRLGAGQQAQQAKHFQLSVPVYR